MRNLKSKYVTNSSLKPSGNNSDRSTYWKLVWKKKKKKLPVFQHFDLYRESGPSAIERWLLAGGVLPSFYSSSQNQPEKSSSIGENLDVVLKRDENQVDLCRKAMARLTESQTWHNSVNKNVPKLKNMKIILKLEMYLSNKWINLYLHTTLKYPFFIWLIWNFIKVFTSLLCGEFIMK